MIVAFIGAISSGKTTAAEYLEERHGYTRHNFADPLRQVMSTLDPTVWWVHDYDDDDDDAAITYNDAVSFYGYRRAKDIYPEIRRFMQCLGTEVGRGLFGENFWVDQWTAGITTPHIVVDDLRFPSELRAIRSLGGKVIRIDRPLFDPTPTPNPHESESHWPLFSYDYKILNDGDISDLYIKIERLFLPRTRLVEASDGSPTLA